MSKQKYEARGASTFKFRPGPSDREGEFLIVIGVDTEVDVDNPNFDARAIEFMQFLRHPKRKEIIDNYYHGGEDPPSRKALAELCGVTETEISGILDQEALILSIARDGVKSPVHVTREGDDVIVCRGRQRTLAAREVERRDGTEIWVPGLDAKGDEQDQLVAMIEENERRREDSPLNRGRKCLQLQNRLWSIGKIARLFLVDVKTIENWIALAQSPLALQELVGTGELPASSAIRLVTSTMGSKEKVDTALEMIESGQTQLHAAAAHVRAQRKKATAPENTDGVILRPGNRVLRAILDYNKEHPTNNLHTEVIKAIKYVLGEIPASSVAGVSKAIKSFEEAQASKSTSAAEKAADKAKKKADKEAKAKAKEDKRLAKEAAKAAKEAAKAAKGTRGKKNAEFSQGEIDLPGSDVHPAPKKKAGKKKPGKKSR